MHLPFSNRAYLEYNKITMTSQVFYRKWRPRTLSEVVGQQHVTQTLRHAVANGRIAHAYLFCGPRGTGKTSTGRILAKAINCLNPEQGEPCNKCQICQAFNEGSALDIIEIDAASNRGIDEIRELIEKVKYAPNLARYKVYIIDEVHMITKEASNAFLKTLEEPPPHAIFVLATTEPHKVLATILSRCQRFDFHRLSQTAVVAKLKYICEKENIHIEPEALRIIAKVTTGSLRDAENLLEQLVAYYGHEIALHQVQAMLGISGDLRIRELAKDIISKDVTAGLKTINSVSSDGLDLRQFNRELVDYLRDLLLVKSGTAEVVDVTSDDLAEMKNLVAGTSLDYLLTAIKCFSEIDFRLNNYSPLPMELALVDCVLSAAEERQLVQPELSGAREKARGTSHSTKLVKPPPEAEVPSSKPTESLEIPKEAPPQRPSQIDYLRSRWKEFINAMRGEGSKGNLDAFLRSACEPLAIEDDTLVLGFYHDFHKKYIEDPKYKHLVEKKLKDVFGQSYQIRCVLTPRDEKAKPGPKTEIPLVKAAREKYGAKIINTIKTEEE